jgi:small subunit ribosomal protein S6
MRRYETIFIVDPDLSDEERSPLFERLKPLFPQLDGFLVMVEEWGTKNLAYEIKKKKRGYYVRLDYCGTGPLVNEIERFFRIDDRILKYMTVLLEKDVDLESLQAELAKAETEEDQPDQTEEADTEQKTVEVMEADTEQKTVEVMEADTEQKPVEVVESDMENSETIQTESNKEEL